MLDRIKEKDWIRVLKVYAIAEYFFLCFAALVMAFVCGCVGGDLALTELGLLDFLIVLVGGFLIAYIGFVPKMLLVQFLDNVADTALTTRKIKAGVNEIKQMLEDRNASSEN